MQVDRPTTIPFPTGPIPLTRVAGLVPFLTRLLRSGTPVDDLLNRAGVPARLLRHPESLIPACQAIGIMERAGAMREAEHPGLRTGADTPIHALGIFGRLIGGSATLGDALDALVRLAPAFDSGSRWWTVP